MADSGNIKVVVRCRPLNSRERNRGASKLIAVNDQHQLVLNPPTEGDSKENARATKKKAMPFSFDRAYDEDTEQRTLFEYVGLELLEHAFNGFNTCVFAYGQTGSGKSHSMVGYAEAKGLIPLTCSRLFDDAAERVQADPNLRISVEVSYIEIYNEKVRDLLNPTNKGNLRVREHPSLGPYVEDLSKLVVSNFSDVENLMDEGNKARTVAATNMNETSSRSHAVFTLLVTQKRKDDETQLEAEKVSRISLVDLAGSERANSTGATGSRLKEGANINRSLTTLGKVIAALATASIEASTKSTPKKKGSAGDHVPYRDSVLTWLLKDSLGGNSKTAMIAAISPADYEETLSTLRYADQAKKIKNKAVVNEDPNAKLIRELKEELEMLRARAASGGSGGGLDGEAAWDPSVPPEKQVVRYKTKTGEIKTVTKAELQEQMEQNEKIMSSLNESWEDKLQKTQQIQQEREKALEELGITIDKGNVGVHTPKNLPHLVNLNEDALMNECLLYQLRPGSTTVGNIDSAAAVQIRLSGSKILSEHCRFENLDGVVTLHAMPDSMTMVNGKRILPDQPKKLRSGYRVILGDFHVFRVNNPSEVRKARDRVKSATAVSNGDASLDASRPDSPASEEGQDVDWTYARREAIVNHLNGQDVGLDHLSNEDLDRLFADISRVRNRKAGASGLSSVGISRPESRLSSVLDDSESSSSATRPYSLSTFTDDTSIIDPWSGLEGAGSRPSETGSHEAPSGKATAQIQKAQTDEAEALRATIRKYEKRFSRLGREATILLDEPLPLTDEEVELVRKVLRRWRSQTGVSMSEDILSNAALLKEANIISLELGKATHYQFTIVDAAPLTNPTSGIEAIAGLTEYDDVADPDLVSGPKPCMAVKVLDYAHNCIYVWSLAKLRQRLQKMQNLYTFIDRPEYSQHFNWADPFYESPAPAYSFYGAALVSALPLTRCQSAQHKKVAIFSAMEGSVVGSCDVEVRFISLTPPPAAVSRRNALAETQTNGHAKAQRLIVGHKLGLQLSVDNVEGQLAENLSVAHLQLRLGSIAGPSLEKDDSFASAPVDLVGQESLTALRLRKTMAIILTPDILAHLQTGLISIEVHGRSRKTHLDRVLKRDEADDSSTSPVGTAALEMAAPARPTSSSNTSKSRLAETELINEQRHDILASIQLCELDASGEYLPVAVKRLSELEVGGGVFQLRQGVQRRVVVKLAHDSGRQLPWVSIQNLSVGDIRLLDGKGRIYDSTQGDMLVLPTPGKQQRVDFHSNGTSTLETWAWWDSSMHDSLFLNRVTSGDQKVLLQISFDVQLPSTATPPRLSTTIAVSVKPRDHRPAGMLRSFIETTASGVQTLNKTWSLFSLKLAPPLAIKGRDLWRLNTSDKYIRGQERLGAWRPLGLEYISRHRDFVRKQQWAARVQGWRIVLRDLHLSKSSTSTPQHDLIARIIELWQSAVQEGKASQARTGDRNGHLEAEALKVDRQPSPRPSESESDRGPSAASAPPPVKYIAQVSLVHPSDQSARKGLLHLLKDSLGASAQDRWVSHFFVLKRPHLLVYADSSERDLLFAIHLGGSVRVEHDENVASLLGEPHVIGLYTSNNSYLLAARDQKDMYQWIGALHGHYASQS
ncbi:unnamed protein product [Parajaminaea phylloscopi]